MRVSRVWVGALIALHITTTESVVPQEVAVLPYGVRNPAAPMELDAFAFFIGKWKGVAKVRLENVTYAQNELIWIGRYVLDGMAIIDEGYTVGADGTARLD